jgi:hypothetical protein
MPQFVANKSKRLRMARKSITALCDQCKHLL